ncbi:ABC transporter permease [Rhodopseudomonas sp. BAL398]|uniref:ABC transporter permease n=1 Tax=Rhodopseudomonas sp. BAL398 TaxID=3034676 RepID=UPI003204BB08
MVLGGGPLQVHPPPRAPRPPGGGAGAQLAGHARSTAYVLLGIGIMLGVWWIGGWLVSSNPATMNFAGFAPVPTFLRLWQMLISDEAVEMALPSLARIGGGLAWAIALGVPFGILIGRFRAVREASSVPFQFLRMISPLAWMPIAVMAFSTWNGAIVFLIGVAAVWPILFSTAHGFRRIDPAWFKVARNLGARPWHMLFTIIVPAIAQDALSGIRLAVGVAWIVLVPAEFLGVTSGLGYSINDARDSLEYDRLGATVVIIGVIGFALDFICERAVRRASWAREE